MNLAKLPSSIWKAIVRACDPGGGNPVTAYPVVREPLVPGVHLMGNEDALQYFSLRTLLETYSERATIWADQPDAPLSSLRGHRIQLRKEIVTRERRKEAGKPYGEMKKDLAKLTAWQMEIEQRLGLK